MPIKDDEKKRIREVVAVIYVDGWTEGASQAGVRYGMVDLVAPAATRMKEPLEGRVRLVDKAVDKYVDLIERKTETLRAKGVTGDQLLAEVSNYARNLADSKADLIAEIEHAEAKLDGAGHVLDEAGVEYVWRFPHFDLGGAHDECPICQAIRERAPYTTTEAEAEGFPSYPHPNCDHGWVVVPKGERTKTEEFPSVETAPRHTAGPRAPRMPKFTLAKYDSSQPRDDQGQWTDGGGSSGGGSSKPQNQARVPQSRYRPRGEVREEGVTSPRFAQQMESEQQTIQPALANRLGISQGSRLDIEAAAMERGITPAGALRNFEDRMKLHASYEALAARAGFSEDADRFAATSNKAREVMDYVKQKDLANAARAAREYQQLSTAAYSGQWAAARR